MPNFISSRPARRATRKSLAGLLILAASMLTPVVGSGPASAAAATGSCSYAQLDAKYPTRTVDGQTLTDGSMWIALRRATDCSYYFVINSKYGSGKSSCRYDIRYRSGNVWGPFNCPNTGGRTDDTGWRVRVYGELTTRYPDGRVYYARTIEAPA
ncbi:MAG: hypothetical protein ABWZ98_11745 [Nakamurella sp.]